MLVCSTTAKLSNVKAHLEDVRNRPTAVDGERSVRATERR